MRIQATTGAGRAEAGRAEAWVLRSDLVRASVRGDPSGWRARGLTWMNTLCGVMLFLGVLGARNPAAWAPREPVGVPVPVVQPVLFEPPRVARAPVDPAGSPDEVDPRPPSTAAAAALVPEVVAVVPAAAVDDAFTLPVEGPTIEVDSIALAVLPPTVPSGPAQGQPEGPVVLQPGRGTPDGGFYPDPEYPRDALVRREQGRTQVLIEVGEEGRVTRVEVRIPSGSATLDRHTVTHVRRFFRFPPGPLRQYLWTAEYVLR